MCSNAIAQRFDCLGVTLEMPFKGEMPHNLGDGTPFQVGGSRSSSRVAVTSFSARGAPSRHVVGEVVRSFFSSFLLPCLITYLTFQGPRAAALGASLLDPLAHLATSLRGNPKPSPDPKP